MGNNFFHRSGRGNGENGESEFAATELYLPTGHGNLPEEVSPSLPPSDFGEGAEGAEGPSSVPPAEPTLSHIGRYALKHPLGRGGLGAVFEAWDPLLSRTVAVKTLQFNVDAPARVSLDSLFLNEARLAAGLNHPCIVTIFDAGLTDHGVYIAMERLTGRDLQQAIDDGWRPDAATAAQLVRRVAGALAYAHARGVVHCDIKPANIFITRRDKPKVLDFGIARAAHGSGRSAFDAAGVVAGSPHYLAPEQLDRGPVDARTDVYSLGVVLYELLTGQRAFDGQSLQDITGAVRRGEVPPAHAVNPGVPPALSAIAARAMARVPADRYPNAHELAHDLRHWADKAPETAEATPAAAPTPTPEAPAVADSAPAATPKARKTRRSGVWLAAGAGLALALGVGAVLLRSPSPAPVAVPAVPPAASPAAQTETPPAAAASPAPDAAPDTAPPAAGAASASASASAAAAPAPEAPTGTKPAPTPKPAANRPRTNAARDAKPVPVAAAPAVTGQVQLAISPWGSVEVDGRALGTTPPLSRLTLPEGAHTITVRNEDFPPLTLTVQVTEDKPVTVRHRFGAGS